MQVEETLIVGVDIASEFHYARALDHGGLELGKLLKFCNNAEGFTQFEVWMSTISERSGVLMVVLVAQDYKHLG